MKVIFEFDNGKRFEVAPEQIKLTMVYPTKTVLTIPAEEEGKVYELMTFPCGLTI